MRYTTILFNKINIEVYIILLFIQVLNDNVAIDIACNILFLLVYKCLWKVEIERRVKQADNSSALPTSPDT